VGVLWTAWSSSVVHQSAPASKMVRPWVLHDESPKLLPTLLHNSLLPSTEVPCHPCLSRNSGYSSLQNIVAMFTKTHQKLCESQLWNKTWTKHWNVGQGSPIHTQKTLAKVIITEESIKMFLLQSSLGPLPMKRQYLF
jgi:hypothetical protein